MNGPGKRLNLVNSPQMICVKSDQTLIRGPIGLPKAEYAVGYFTEMGIGCRRDPLEANVWYVRAADHDDKRAKHRIAAIRAAASGGGAVASSSRTREDGAGENGGGIGKEDEEKGKKKWGIF